MERARCIRRKGRDSSTRQCLPLPQKVGIIDQQRSIADQRVSGDRYNATKAVADAAAGLELWMAHEGDRSTLAWGA